MSIKVMEKAFTANIKPIPKLVMLCLADNANNEGVCFPSINTLASKSGLSKRSVIDNIAKLEEDNLLIKKYRNRKKGGRSSNKYLLFPLQNSAHLSEEDYEIFKEEILNLKTQSEGDALPPQSEGDALGSNSQSEGDALESEPSLNIFNHHLYKQLSKTEKSLYNEYIELRATMKVKTTFNIQQRLLTKYFEFGRDVSVIENAITANWKDFYEPKKANNATWKKEAPVGSLEWERQQMLKQQGAIDAELI